MTTTSPNKTSCSHCSFTPFCQASVEDIDTCQESSLVVNTRKLARNEVLCTRDHKFQSLFAIEQGAVKAYQVDSQGREHINSFYFAGEVLGYRAIHTGFYLSSVVALTDSVVCEMPYQRFLELLKHKPALNQQILALFSRQLTVGAYADSATAMQRIAAFIMDLSQRIRTSTSSLHLPMSRQDIGNYLGLSGETVSRLLTRLQAEDVLSIDGKFIQIKDVIKLRNLAE